MYRNPDRCKDSRYGGHNQLLLQLRKTRPNRRTNAEGSRNLDAKWQVCFERLASMTSSTAEDPRGGSLTDLDLVSVIDFPCLSILVAQRPLL